MNRIYTADINAKKHIPALIANGMVGIRPGLNPLAPSTCVVPGFITEKKSGNETQTETPYPFAVRVTVGEKDITATANPVSQCLDMNTGRLVSITEYAEGIRITSEITALRRPASVLTMRLKVDGRADLKVYPTYTTDEKNDKYGLRFLFKDRERPIDTYACKTPVSRLGISIGTNRIDESTLDIAACLVPSFYSLRPETESMRIMSYVLMQGIDTLIKRNDDAWRELWQAAPVIEGPDWAQKAVDEAYFYLIESTNPSSKLGVACYAQSNALNLNGQIFWDMDFYVTPALALLQPETAKAFARYRVACLKQAEKRASMYGYAGAMYPWQSGLYGTEETDLGCACGWAEQHINGDVAVSLWEVACACGDDDFIRDEVWPVLKGVADWIASRGEFTERGYEITNIMGVDEGSSDNKNNLFCNAVFRMAIKAAIDCAEKLGKDVPTVWRKVWEKMFFARAEDGRLLVNEGAQLVAEDRISYSPGMLQFLWVHGPEKYGAVSVEDFKKLYQFEEEIRLRLPDDCSNPASAYSPGFVVPPMALSAAFFGEKEKAEKLIRQSHDRYTSKPYAVLTEYPMLERYEGFNTGEYITGHGSIIEHITLGFTGMRLACDGLTCYPACLPAGWKKITLPRIRYKGRLYKAEAEDGKKAVLTPIEE